MVSRLDREYRSLLDRLVEGVITLIAVAFGVHWAMDLLLPTIPFLIGVFVIASVLAGIGWWLKRRKTDRY